MRWTIAASLALAAALPVGTGALAGGADVPAACPPAQAAAHAVNAFTVDLLRAAAAKGGNAFLSPYSIASAVAMARAGAKGATAAQIDQALHLPADAPAAFRELGAALAAAPWIDQHQAGHFTPVPAYALAVANGLFAHRGAAIEPAFGATLRDAYAAELREVDFEDGPAARKVVNDWVAAKTKDRIQDIVPAGLPTPDTRMTLANAIHFKAQWANVFDARSTREKPFTVSPGTEVTSRMMFRLGRYPYAATADADVVELPYQSGAVSMVVILPKAADGLDAFLAALTPERLEACIAGLSPRRVRLELPKLTFTTALEATAALRALGIRDAFDAGAADFTGITSTTRFAVGSVLHKAFVAVDESGTEAAAATAVTTRGEGRPEPETPFVANHPFLFVIRHRATGAILFAGRVTDPTSKG